MQIRSIAGVSESVHITGVSDMGVYGKKKKKPSKLKAKLKKAAGGVKKLAKKAFQGAKTVGLAPARNAFLLLVRLNVFGIATKLNQLVTLKGWGAVKFWAQVGGNRTNLEKAAKAGAKKKRIFGIGSVSIGAAITAATPIIIKLNALLKQYGIKPASKESSEGAEQTEEQTKDNQQNEAEGDEQANNIVTKLAVKRGAAAPAASSLQNTSEDEADDPQQNTLSRSARRSGSTASNNAVTNPNEEDELQEKPKKKKSTSKKILGMSPKTAALVGGGVLGLGILGFVLTRKKGKGKK